MVSRFYSLHHLFLLFTNSNCVWIRLVQINCLFFSAPFMSVWFFSCYYGECEYIYSKICQQSVGIRRVMCITSYLLNHSFAQVFRFIFGVGIVLYCVLGIDFWLTGLLCTQNRVQIFILRSGLFLEIGIISLQIFWKRG